MNEPVFFLGCPTHDGRIERECADILFSGNSQYPGIIAANTSSLLTQNCNHLYATALNAKKQYPSLKWFGLLHSDIAPEPFYIDKLIMLAEHHNADFMSVVVPFKNASGLTSTAVGKGCNWITRLTQSQLWDETLPDTFDLAAANVYLKNDTADRLFANTGCMIVRLDQPWSDKLEFKMIDSIDIDKQGKFTATCFPEDWYFSKSVADHGGKVMCTRLVSVKHIGGGRYSNQQVWGDAIDPHARHI